MELNEIFVYETYAEIILYDKDGYEESRAIIDLDDVDKCKTHRWNRDKKNSYAQNHKIGRLHNFIMNFNPPKDRTSVVNHINRNRLDCRKKNLEITTYQKNGINKGKQSNNTSGHPGVSWDNGHNKWEANIKLNNKKKFLGYYNNLNDAIKARREGEYKYFGETVNRDNDKYTVYKKKI